MRKNKSKRANHVRVRRRVRRQENARSDDAPVIDKMIGRACRRLWGCGRAL